MKKILFTISLLWMLAGTGNAQHFDFESDLMCWDSAGVKKIQLKSYNLFAVGNAEGRWMGYFDSQGNLTLVPVNEITEGDCNLIEIKENTSTSKDTSVNVICMMLTRQILNTVNSGALYPKHVLEKHVISVGGQIVDTKFYEPHDMQLVESPVLDISVLSCEDFYILDFQNMSLNSDTTSVADGDTSSITFNFYASVISIGCSGTGMNEVQLDFTFANTSIEGVAQTVAGNKRVFLDGTFNSFYQKWEYQRIQSIDIIAIGGDCKCKVTYSHEWQKF